MGDNGGNHPGYKTMSPMSSLTTPVRGIEGLGVSEVVFAIAFDVPEGDVLPDE